MTRALIYSTGDLVVNIPADKLIKQNDFIEIYLNDELKGIFDVGIVTACYITEQASKNNEKKRG